jgi:hypothetical protein
MRACSQFRDAAQPQPGRTFRGPRLLSEHGSPSSRDEAAAVHVRRPRDRGETRSSFANRGAVGPRTDPSGSRRDGAFYAGR